MLYRKRWKARQGLGTRLSRLLLPRLCVPGVRVTPCLPEPPAVRERLVQEIQFFVEYLQQQQQQQRREHGGSSGTVSALSEENSRVILDYVAKRKGANVLLFCCFVVLLLMCTVIS